MNFIKTFSAHGYGQLVTVLTNFILPSVLIKSLGVDDFGFWVVAGAVSQFIMYSDLGFGAALANLLAIKNKNNTVNYKSKRKIIFTILVLGAIVGFLSALIATAILLLLSNKLFSQYEGIKNINYVLLFVMMVAGLNSVNSIVIVCSRIENKLAGGIIFTNTVRLIEGFAIIISSILSGSLVVVSFSYFSIRFLYFIGVVSYVVRVYGIPVGRRDYIRLYFEIKSLKKAAIPHFTSGVSQGFSIHAPILLVGYFMGPVSAAIYSVTRAMCRIPVQFIGIFLSSVAPHLTNVGINSIKKLKNLTYKLVFFVTALMAFFYFSVVMYGLDNLSNQWMHGKINIENTAFYILITGTMCSTISLVFINSCTSINSKLNLGIIQLIAFFGAVPVIFIINALNLDKNAVFMIFSLVDFFAMAVVFLLFRRM